MVFCLWLTFVYCLWFLLFVVILLFVVVLCLWFVVIFSLLFIICSGICQLVFWNLSADSQLLIANCQLLIGIWNLSADSRFASPVSSLRGTRSLASPNVMVGQRFLLFVVYGYFFVYYLLFRFAAFLLFMI